MRKQLLPVRCCENNFKLYLLLFALFKAHPSLKRYLKFLRQSQPAYFFTLLNKRLKYFVKASTFFTNNSTAGDATTITTCSLLRQQLPPSLCCENNFKLYLSLFALFKAHPSLKRYLKFLRQSQPVNLNLHIQNPSYEKRRLCLYYNKSIQ